MSAVIKGNENQEDFRVIVKNTYTRLVAYKGDSEQEKFNKELLKIIPEINRYVANRLKTAVLKGKLNKGIFYPNDFTDQLFIEVYDNLDKIKADTDLYPFLFGKVDELLEDSLVKEEFDHVFFDNIDTYSKPEWDAMEEKYTQDGDGDFVMLEDLDDASYKKNNYTLNHIFITDEEKELAKKLDSSMNRDRVEGHITFVLDKMTMPMRAVFQLYTDQGFSIQDISKIRKSNLVEVQQLLDKARELLKESFAKRFLIDSN